MVKENGKLAKPILIAGAGRNNQTDDVADKASEAAINAAIDSARGKIGKNVPTCSDIFVAADNAEKRLESLKIPVADRQGAIVHFRPEAPDAKAARHRDGARHDGAPTEVLCAGAPAAKGAGSARP